MRVKSHQLPITMRMAMEFTEDSPPTGGQQNGLALGVYSHSHPHRNAPAPPWGLAQGTAIGVGLGSREVSCWLVMGDCDNPGEESKDHQSWKGVEDHQIRKIQDWPFSDVMFVKTPRVEF